MFSKFFENFDFWILSCVLAIAAFSVTILWSIRPDLVLQQIIFFIFGLFLFFLFSEIDYRLFFHFRWPIYLLICLALLITLLLAPQTRGAVRWFQIGGWYLQPSEILKPLLILAFAGFLSLSSSISVKRLIFILVLAVPTLLLIFKQPDLGNTVVFWLIFISLLIMGGMRWFLFAGGLIVTLGVIPLFWNFLKDYQKERIVSFLSPQSDPLGSGYNLIQTMVTVGSGQIFGRGLGMGTQSHLRFLPEQHTDFIFAALSEELGFLGAMLLIVFYGFLLWRILNVARCTKDPFGTLIAVGVFAMILTQVFVNIGMNTGILPITGITLPLMSYGGSSVVSMMISLGIVESIVRSRRREGTLEIR